MGIDDVAEITKRSDATRWSWSACFRPGRDLVSVVTFGV
jgi:hypothetical protein